MIDLTKIQQLIQGHIPPYVYNGNKFIEGESTVLYSGPYWGEEEIAEALNAFLNGKWLVSGEKVNEFEKEFSKIFNVKYSHMVNSGSSANLILLAGLKRRFTWEDNDEIIVSPVGFATTISSIYQNRLKPIFVDIEWDTLNFDLNLIENKITSKTKAIFVSPVLGNPPDIDRLLEICEKYDLKLIGDNCDSLGSKWNGKYLNEYYVAFSNSFYPAHHITTGEGGMVCTNDIKLKRLFMSLSWWGRACTCIGSDNLLQNGSCGKRFSKWLEGYDKNVDHKYLFNEMGYNLKPLDMQGAIGLVQLKKLNEIDEKRKKSRIEISRIFLENIQGLEIPKTLDKADPSWFGTPFICPTSELKHKLVDYLEKNKIQTRNYFAGNILQHSGYSFLDDMFKYPEANKVLDKVFFIGAAPHYNEDIFNYIEKIVKNFKP